MDTSKKYIEMCYSKEIQELSKRETGDYYYQIKDDEETSKGVFVCWNGLKPNGCYHNWDNDWYFPENCIWLPRQDQLQEIILKDWVGKKPYWLLFKFYNWTDLAEKENSWINVYTSMEQLWLAFVMEERYNKMWDKNEKWIKCKK